MPEDLPLSVWATAQESPAAQRRGRYIWQSNAHRGRMLPDVARHAIRAYTRPGDLVLDPQCGIGTTLVEAIHLGRDSLGLESDERWAAIARANVAHAHTQGAVGRAPVLPRDGDTGNLMTDLAERVALVLTSAPSGQGNPSPSEMDRKLRQFRAALEECVPALRPGGVAVVTARPWRHNGVLVDLPSAVASIAQHVGLIALERNVALLAGLRGDAILPRVTHFQMQQVRRAGSPLRIIAHEDVLVFRRADA